MRAEGIPCGQGYIGKPIYLCMDALASKRTFGSSSHPLDGCHGGRRLDYVEGMCPRTEAILRQMITLTIHEHLADEDVADMAEAICKVADALSSKP